jgi:hypothetical protein
MLAQSSPPAGPAPAWPPAGSCPSKPAPTNGAGVSGKNRLVLWPGRLDVTDPFTLALHTSFTLPLSSLCHPSSSPLSDPAPGAQRVGKLRAGVGASPCGPSLSECSNLLPARTCRQHMRLGHREKLAISILWAYYYQVLLLAPTSDS